MLTDQTPFLSRFKWHILLVAFVVIPVVSFSVSGDHGTGVGGVSSALLYCGAAILLGAILYMLVRISTLTDAAKGNSAKLDGLTKTLSRITDELAEISQTTRLSESAKAIAFRDTERSSLQEAVALKLQRQEFEAAYELIDDIAERREYRDLAERLRNQAQQLQGEAREERIRQFIRQIEGLLEDHHWSKASLQIEGLIKAFPNADAARALRQKLFVAKGNHKKTLLSAWDESVKEQDTDRGLEILKQLDLYLTPNEALALQEAAKDIFKSKLHNLGVQFSMAVSDRNWDDALKVGQQIIEGFPNSRMSGEIREKLSVLKQNVAVQL
ncbi:MAG: hypothetical protein IH892_23355 [Planctomycetes bacterium]|nr:hypothetical protein [Planctomycetota bacterium]